MVCHRVSTFSLPMAKNESKWEEIQLTISKAGQEQIGGLHAIPELAPQWKKLNLAEILKRKAAFVSISQNKCLYESDGVSGTKIIVPEEVYQQR